MARGTVLKTPTYPSNKSCKFNMAIMYFRVSNWRTCWQEQQSTCSSEECYWSCQSVVLIKWTRDTEWVGGDVFFGILFPRKLDLITWFGDSYKFRGLESGMGSTWELLLFLQLHLKWFSPLFQKITETPFFSTTKSCFAVPPHLTDTSALFASLSFTGLPLRRP